MMSAMSTLLFIASLFNTLNAQSGAGCFTQTPCPTGQVRMDAVVKNGQFFGGCVCGCSSDLYNPSSPLFCSSPNEVRFNTITKKGDCACATPTTPAPTKQSGVGCQEKITCASGQIQMDAIYDP